MKKKRWFDDWKITRNLDGLGEIKIYLPNSEAGDKVMIIWENDQSEEMLWIISFLETSLMELTKENEMQS